MADLSRKSTRARLPKLSKNGEVRTEPHWQRLGKGQYLGYRTSAGTWVARYGEAAAAVGAKGKQHFKALDGIQADDYDGALEAATEWLSQVATGAGRPVKRSTVRAALEAYVADLKRQGRDGTATEALGRFQSTVFDDRIASRPLESVTHEEFETWRERLREGRQPRSVNRQVRAVAAALTRATKLGHVGNKSAWTLTALADDVEDAGESAVFLDAAQRKAVIAAASPAAATFLRGLELTGCRPKELAAAYVRDFDGKTLRLAHRKGRGAKLKTRRTVLGPEGVDFFAALATDKEPDARLFSEDAEGNQWRRHFWARAVRAAIAKVNKEAKKPSERIPAGASAYSFRHARISELLQVHGVDPLTVAHQTGTSLAMIEKAYLRFIPQALADKLAAVRA